MNALNRLEAAKSLSNSHHVIPDGQGAYNILLHVAKHAADEGWEPGLYVIHSKSNDVYQASPNTADWKRIGWKDLLLTLRGEYVRRNEFSCPYIHGSGARCTWIGEDHNHCKKCGEANLHTHLCFKCGVESDNVRYDLTRQLAAYHNTFGIPFEKMQEEYDHMVGAFDDMDDLPRGDRDREDFHADG